VILVGGTDRAIHVACPAMVGYRNEKTRGHIVTSKPGRVTCMP